MTPDTDLSEYVAELEAENDRLRGSVTKLSENYETLLKSHADLLNEQLNDSKNEVPWQQDWIPESHWPPKSLKKFQYDRNNRKAEIARPIDPTKKENMIEKFKNKLKSFQ